MERDWVSWCGEREGNGGSVFVKYNLLHGSYCSLIISYFVVFDVCME